MISLWVISDAKDLLVWLEAIIEGRLLKNKGLMFDYIDVSDYYGIGDVNMGFRIFLKNGSVGQDGFSPGCQPIFFGDKNACIVIHTNKTVTLNWGEETEVYKIYSDLNDLINFNV